MSPVAPRELSGEGDGGEGGAFEAGVMTEIAGTDLPKETEAPPFNHGLKARWPNIDTKSCLGDPPIGLEPEQWFAPER